LVRRGRPHETADLRPATGRNRLRLAIGAAALLVATLLGQGESRAEDRALRLYNLHTHERATIVFKRNGTYDRGGLEALNNFLRDWRKERPTTMDPHLFDLLWQVYRDSGSQDYIQVVCGYRSPETNGMLRRRSSAVAKNSLHMQGKAMDFFLTDVPLAKLREIGLKMQLGGVGFYPTSGSPFVHMDTGSVRHWPRMTREQLVRVFPNGHTLHIPSDGKPLPGYEEALAAYQARKAGATALTQVASFAGPSISNRVIGKPMALAAKAPVADEGDEADDTDTAATAAAPTTKPAAAPVGVAVASYATSPVPMPRLAPKVAPPPPPVVAAADLPAPPVRKPDLTVRTIAAALAPAFSIPDFDFGSPQDWSAPAVPAALASAMAERDQTRRVASLPIAPTSVVSTIDVNRPLRAEAITTAVLRSSNDTTLGAVPGILAYASPTLPAEPPAEPTVRRASAVAGVPLPQVNPVRAATVASARPAAPSLPPRRMMAAGLTMTALDTQSLRMWIGAVSTRQKFYALLTMPDLGNGRNLMEKPDVAFAAGFGQSAYFGLRTDRFSGVTVQQPTVVDLRLAAR
jgi:uncharacterized protein YcbK (DUF882 family)